MINSIYQKHLYTVVHHVLGVHLRFVKDHVLVVMLMTITSNATFRENRVVRKPGRCWIIRCAPLSVVLP